MDQPLYFFNIKNRKEKQKPHLDTNTNRSSCGGKLSHRSTRCVSSCWPTCWSRTANIPGGSTWRPSRHISTRSSASRASAPSTRDPRCSWVEPVHLTSGMKRHGSLVRRAKVFYVECQLPVLHSSSTWPLTPLRLRSRSSSDDYPEIKRLFPSADIQYIPDASHWIHADKPLDFISSVITFLQS